MDLTWNISWHIQKETALVQGRDVSLIICLCLVWKSLFKNPKIQNVSGAHERGCAQEREFPSTNRAGHLSGREASRLIPQTHLKICAWTQVFARAHTVQSTWLDIRSTRYSPEYEQGVTKRNKRGRPSSCCGNYFTAKATQGWLEAGVSCRDVLWFLNIQIDLFNTESCSWVVWLRILFILREITTLRENYSLLYCHTMLLSCSSIPTCTVYRRGSMWGYLGVHHAATQGRVCGLRISSSVHDACGNQNTST